MFRLIIAFILISSPIFAEEICPREEGCPVKNGVCIGCIIEGSLEKIQWEHHSLMNAQVGKYSSGSFVFHTISPLLSHNHWSQ